MWETVWVIGNGQSNSASYLVKFDYCAGEAALRKRSLSKTPTNGKYCSKRTIDLLMERSSSKWFMAVKCSYNAPVPMRPHPVTLHQ